MTKLERESLDLLEEVKEFLDNYIDVVDGANGEPAPNKAMRLYIYVDELLAHARGERWPR